MRETVIVMRRELRSYFLSPIAYVFGGLFLLFVMGYSSIVCLQPGLTTSAAVTNFFGLLPLVLLVFLPALTMRLWSEERKLGTLELLLTFPVKIRQLIAGKFLAAMAFLVIMLALTAVLPAMLAWHGNVDWGPVLAAYLASLFLASAFVACGMFWSSVTRDQIIAMLLASVSLILLWLMGSAQATTFLAESLGFPDPVVGAFKALSPIGYFQSILRGVIDTRDLVYYVCFCGFFLYANAMVLQQRRHSG